MDQLHLAAAKPAVVPTAPVGIAEPQLDNYDYGQTTLYGSNVSAAWRYTSGKGVTVGLVDDGFDPATTATYGNFSTALSRSFDSSSSGIGEAAGGYHGTTTSGLIGATGVNDTPEGLAPNATIVGVKVGFSTATIQILTQAEQYATSVSSVVNNSWAFDGYGAGDPSDPTFAAWYSAIHRAVAFDRDGLGDVITFAAGNDRQQASSLSVEPLTADYRSIAVAATDANGSVGFYSTPGAALLVSAIGDNVAVADTGGSGNSVETGTSYSAPTVAAIAALMLSVNPALGWRDVQEILADASYVPAPSAGSFVYNGAQGWNGGGMHFSNDLGFGVVDANVAVNLARAWKEQSTSANLVSTTVSHTGVFTVGANATASATVTDSADIRIQHVEITINDSYLPIAWSKITLISPDGTASVLVNQIGLVGGNDQTGGLDVSGDTLTSNAFWGENATGTWILRVQDISGATVGTINSFGLTFLGDNAGTVGAPLVYTPEFASLATTNSPRTDVSPGSSTTIDLAALPGTTTVDLNGGAGVIDGVAVTVDHGLRNANADGSTGLVTLTGLTTGGSELTGGDDQSILKGYGGDAINAGLGSTSITANGDATVITLDDRAASNVTINSGGSDTVYAGMATATITSTGSRGDHVYDQSAQLTFINGNAASRLSVGGGTVVVQAGAGGGFYAAGNGGNSQLIAGTGVVTFYGSVNGDRLTAAGAGADTLIAGAGVETLSGGASTGSIVLQAGSGYDTMAAGQGETTFIVGSGDSAITTGGVASIIQIHSGQAGGFDTVAGFRIGVDDLHLVGFTAQAANTAVGSETLDGKGGTLLTFSDNTRIDLLDLAQITATSFV